MEQLTLYLKNLIDDIFKLLPMKEDEMSGGENHLDKYIESLIINIEGSLLIYPELKKQKKFLYVLNDIKYISNQTVDFKQWRRIVLSSTRKISEIVNDIK